VHEVKDVKPWGQVIDEKGDAYDTRRVLPVPAASGTLQIGRQGNAAVDARRVERYDQFRAPLIAWLKRKGQTQNNDGVQIEHAAKLSELSRYARQLGMVFPQKKPTPTEIMRLLGFRTWLEGNVQWVAPPPV
jgi:hypothetical protein